MNNFFNTYICDREKKIPSHCEYCGFVLMELEDTKTAYKHGSCRDCFVGFIEVNKNLNGDEWSPSDSEIKDWVSKLRKVFKPIYRF
tara:strand:- start:45 stop:302 length:258 start_codon:yes stop_codon:yes gene_type:complete